MRINRLKTLSISMVLLMTSICMTFGEPLSPEKETLAKSKLLEIQEEEKKTLEELFSLSSEIMLIETQIRETNTQIEDLYLQSDQKENQIDEESMYYEKIKKSLAAVLKSQQRAGVTSNINLILEAESIKDLIRRINLLRDLSRNTEKLIHSLEVSKQNLTKEQNELILIVANLEKQKQVLKTRYDEQIEAKRELDLYLQSLASEKVYYQDYLTSVEDVWKSMKRVLSETIESFTEIIETGALPDDTVEVKRILLGARGIIYEEKFNAILATRDELPQLDFEFYSDKVTLSFDEYEFYVEGRFELVDDQTIKYVVDNGTFYGLPLSRSAMEELFSEGDLMFSLELLIGDNRIKRIDYYNGRIELMVTGSQF